MIGLPPWKYNNDSWRKSVINFLLTQKKGFSRLHFHWEGGWGCAGVLLFRLDLGSVLQSYWVGSCLTYLCEGMTLAMNTVVFPASLPTSFQKEHSQRS